MQAVLMSRVVQYGSGNMVELYAEAVHSMFNDEKKDYSGWPNLTYVNDKAYDYDMIAAIYDFLISEADSATWTGEKCIAQRLGKWQCKCCSGIKKPFCA